MLSRFGKATTGFLLGLCLGPIGLVIALVIRSNAVADEEKGRHLEQMATLRKAPAEGTGTADPRDERECPFCAERILSKAKVCKHCGHEVLPLETGVRVAKTGVRLANKDFETDDFWIINCPGAGPQHPLMVPKRRGLLNTILLCKTCGQGIDYPKARDIALFQQ